MAEHGLDGPVIGIAYDGTGYGPDGTSWGGEILVADAATFVRAATFRPLPLVGGDRAIREPWRIALALVHRRVRRRPACRRCGRSCAGVAGARRRPGARCARAIGCRCRARTASAATSTPSAPCSWAAAPRASKDRWRWSGIRRPIPACATPIRSPSSTPWRRCELDLRPAVWAAVADFRGGATPSAIAARFHNTLATATAALVRRAARAFGPLPVVASGGCFQNARLAERRSRGARAGVRRAPSRGCAAGRRRHRARPGGHRRREDARELRV